MAGQSGIAQITVTVNDGAASNNTIVRTFDVNVTAVDGSPIFTASGPFGVSEAAPITTVIGNVDANDGDGGGADVGITYSITTNVNPDGDGVPAVAIDSATGVLTVADADDFDAEGVNPLVITVQADDSVQQTSTDVTINIGDANDAPIVTAAGNQTMDEGSLFAGTVATFTDQDTADSHTATIDWGDLTTPDSVGSVTSPIGGSHTYVDDGVYTVTVEVSDGTDPGSDSFTFTVDNVAPVVGSFAGDTVYAGASYTSSGSFTDVGTSDVHTGTVDWGEGGGPVPLTLGGGDTFNLSHTYATAGPYTVEVCVSDGTDEGCNTASVTVVARPTVTFGAATSSPWRSRRNPYGRSATERSCRWDPG